MGRALDISRISTSPAICVRASGREAQPLVATHLALQKQQFRECSSRSGKPTYGTKQWIATSSSEPSKRCCADPRSNAGGAELDKLRSRIIHEIYQERDADFLNKLLSTIEGRKRVQHTTSVVLCNIAGKQSDLAGSMATQRQKRKLPWTTSGSGAAASSKQ